MSEREWEKFFNLLDKVVNLSMPVVDKIKLIKEKAQEYDAETNIEEFTNWDFE